MRFINLKTKAEVCSIPYPTILCVGNFDGVHLGHRQLINSVLDKKSELKKAVPNVVGGAWFFDSNFYKNTDEIYSLDEKLSALASLDLDYAIIADFNEMKSLSPSDFVNVVLKIQCGCIHAICGENFRFGSRASGDSNALLKLMDGSATVVPLLKKDGAVISSTYIRHLLSIGDIDKSNLLLSSNYSIKEKVVYGKQLGRRLGLPTINQNVINKNLILKSGIYATICTIDEKKYYGVTNIGTRPTVDTDQVKNVETHVIDFDGDCYDKEVRVEFVSRLRDEVKFNGIEELKLQIQKDVEVTKNIFHL